MSNNRSKTNLELVAEFMTAMGQGVSQGWGDVEGMGLGYKLIKEEFEEFDEGILSATLFPTTESREHLVKELADLVYVCYWFAAKVGINLDEAFRLVHESNMSKLGADGKAIFNEAGKVMKGPNYKLPDLSHVVKDVPISII